MAPLLGLKGLALVGTARLYVNNSRRRWSCTDIRWLGVQGTRFSNCTNISQRQQCCTEPRVLECTGIARVV